MECLWLALHNNRPLLFLLQLYFNRFPGSFNRSSFTQLICFPFTFLLPLRFCFRLWHSCHIDPPFADRQMPYGVKCVIVMFIGRTVRRSLSSLWCTNPESDNCSVPLCSENITVRVLFGQLLLIKSLFAFIWLFLVLNSDYPFELFDDNKVKQLQPMRITTEKLRQTDGRIDRPICFALCFHNLLRLKVAAKEAALLTTKRLEEHRTIIHGAW